MKKAEIKMMTDEDLMAAFKTGESAAFEELLTRHKDKIFRFMMKFLGNKQATEEAAQEVFFNVIRASDRYEPKAKFSTWLYRIAHNYSIDCLRRAKLRRTESLDEPMGEGPELRGDWVCDSEPSSETQVAQREVHQLFDHALQTLNPDQREVFLMRENQGLAFHEISQVLNLSTNTVKSRMRYALDHLRKNLERTQKPLNRMARPV